MKTVIIFGATSGIGKEMTKLLVKDNYKVAITGRRLEKLDELKKTFPNQILVKQNDIQQVNDVEKVFTEIVAEFGTVDLIIQSSGVGTVNPKLEWELEKETILTNVLGVTKLYDLAFNLFRKQQFGHLVGISSNELYTREDIVKSAIEKAKKYFKTTTFKTTISVGDGIWDLKTAKNLGVHFLGIRNKNLTDFKREHIKSHIHNWSDFNFDKVQKELGIT